jgi:signal transduction histidine kinase
VLGWARVLRTTRVNDETRQRALEVIERNARAQAHLIEDLLEISRIVAGKPTLRVRPVDLAEIVDNAVEVVRPAATAKNIELLTDVSVRPAVTSGDPDRLQQIVWNLVSNAVKFTSPNGAATIRLTKKDGFRVEVSDTGQGIDPALSAARVRRVPPGRRHDDSRAWRSRAWADDRTPARRAARRHHHSFIARNGPRQHVRADVTFRRSRAPARPRTNGHRGR